MTELLHWAVQHSDPVKLAEVMRRYKEQNLTLRDVYGQDVMDALFVDEAGVMAQLIERVADFRSASLSDGELGGALMQLQELVEQVDNAANLHRLGGLEPLLELALGSARHAEPRRLALWTLGVAVQNNPPVQEELLGLRGLQRLARHLPRCHGGPPEGPAEDAQFCGKLLFALSGLIKNNVSTQAAANELGVFRWLFKAGIRHESPAVVKKSLGLLETVLAQSSDLEVLDELPALQDEIAEALLAHIRGPGASGTDGDSAHDHDLAEKALGLLSRLLSVRPMLFAPGFRAEFTTVASGTLRRCARVLGEDSVCEGLAALTREADAVLVAREAGDGEL